MEHRVTYEEARAFGEYTAAHALLQKEKSTRKPLGRPWKEPESFSFTQQIPVSTVTNDHRSVAEHINPLFEENTLLKEARENLVIKQLLPCQVISPRVLEAFLQIPRDIFIPGYEGSTIAYADATFPLGNGRVCMEPRVLGRLLQETDMNTETDVLLVGCGTGYEAAVISRLVRHVTAIETDEAFVRKAQENLARLNISNVRVVKVAQMTEHFWPNFVPYDVVLINGAIEGEPDPHFANMLKYGNLMRRGGLLLTVRRENEYLGKAMRYQNIRGRLYGREITHAQVPIMSEFRQPERFEF